MKLLTLAIPVALVMVAPSFAQSPSDYDRMYSKCVKAEGGPNNAVVGGCSAVTSDKAKAEINKRYTTIYAKILAENPGDAKTFEISQKAWVQYRNLHCDLAGAYIGSPMYNYCPMGLNSARALELRELDGD